jgi:hypothetical protein
MNTRDVQKKGGGDYSCITGKRKVRSLVIIHNEFNGLFGKNRQEQDTVPTQPAFCLWR